MTRIYPNAKPNTAAGGATAGGEAKVVEKAVRAFGRSRVVGVEGKEGPTYQHRFLAKPETVSVSALLAMNGVIACLAETWVKS